MFDLPEVRTREMPSELGFLLKDYPRADWALHPGFAEKTRHWMGAHQMFRRLAEIIRLNSEAFLDKTMDKLEYASRLAHYGDALVRNLHGHHGWEDRVYFPEMSAADPRFDAGLELLEKDHVDLDVILEHFTTASNRTLKLFQLEPAQALGQVAKVQDAAVRIEAFLERHLQDEEDLIVPIILHHRLRG